MDTFTIEFMAAIHGIAHIIGESPEQTLGAATAREVLIYRGAFQMALPEQESTEPVVEQDDEGAYERAAALKAEMGI